MESPEKLAETGDFAGLVGSLRYLSAVQNPNCEIEN
jgi:hypothetical protein